MAWASMCVQAASASHSRASAPLRNGSYHFRIWRSPYQAMYPTDAKAATVTVR